MRVHNQHLKLSALALALAGVMSPVASFADDDEAAALKKPSNYLQFGIANTDSSSARFGEYNGLNKSGTTFVGGLSIRGGDAYGDSGGTMRWSVTGSDLGLTTRTLGGTLSDQGRWSLGIRYDELRHNLTDSYQTPYIGTVGGSSWTLPAGFVSANARALTPAQLAAFRQIDVYSERKNTSINAGLNLNAQWEIKFDYNHLDQSGAKLMGFGAAKPGGAATNEYVSILPAPTNYKTDTVNLALNWVGEKAHASASYYGSYFRNDFDRINFQTWGVANLSQTMSTPPGNDLHQFNLSGGYAVLAKTKLAGNLSYSRNTQNQGYAVDQFMFVPASPASGNTMTSANALVVNTHADLKLTDQSFKDLTLTAGYKYDLRDNRTASNIYNFFAISGGNIANYPNTPLSIKKTQYELSGDYRIRKDHHLRVALTREDTERWCAQYAVNAGYPAGTNCVVARSAAEDKIDTTYRFKPSDSVNVRFGYSQGTRMTSFNTNARAAFISTNGGVAGQNGGDFIGFHPFLDANRTQRALKGNINWDISEQWSLGLGGRYTADRYGATYGIESGNSWSANLDAAYRYSENGTLTGFVSQQHMERIMTDLQRAFNATLQVATATAVAVPPGATWTDRLKSDDVTFGFGVKHTGLQGGKLDVAADVSQSRATSAYSNQLNYQTFTTGGLDCANPIILSCGDTPTVKIRVTQLKLNGTYQVDKKSKVNLAYMFQRLGGTDYYYNGYQLGYTPTQLLPTNQQLGNHAVSVISASYIYSF
jgi:MtrB/PioB family decaheme-associated outer membrane protein